jgi:hypothetical protein
MPSYSARPCRPNVVINLSSTINVDLLHAIVERVETLEICVPSLKVDVKLQKAIIRDLHAQITASSRAPAAPTHLTSSTTYPPLVPMHKPTTIAPSLPQPSNTTPCKPKVATQLTAAQSYTVATSLYLPPPPPPPPVWKTHQSKHQKKQKQHVENPFAPAKNLPVEACRIVFL